MQDSERFMRLPAASRQVAYLLEDLARMINHRPHRLLGVLFGPQFLILSQYRLEHALYLLMGRGWSVLRILFLPLLALLRPWMGSCDIHYRADIGPGFKILHPELGAVVSARTVAGCNLTLVGGNCIGMRKREGGIWIGDNVTLGVNAVVLGPVYLGNRVSAGAGAVVVSHAPDGATLVGVPARIEPRAAAFPETLSRPART